MIKGTKRQKNSINFIYALLQKTYLSTGQNGYTEIIILEDKCMSRTTLSVPTELNLSHIVKRIEWCIAIAGTVSLTTHSTKCARNKFTIHTK